MSYAEAAAKGPPQSAEEVEQTTDVSAQRTVDVDSAHVNAVPADYSGATDTQVERLQREAEEAESAARRRFHELEETARRDYARGKAGAKEKGKGAEKALRHAAEELRDNSDNPVVVGNALVWTVVAGVLGYGAYQQHSQGKLNWKVAGAWAGAVSLFAAGDYYLSQYLFKNKYPPK